MTEQRVYTINQQGEKLAGLMSIPDRQSDKYPAVILVHGFGVSYEEGGYFGDMAAELNKAGLCVVRFSFSGRGKSQGDYAETSLTKMKQDLQSMLDFTRNQEQIDQDKIGILGHSLGVTNIVTLNPDVQCMILTSSVYRPLEVLKKVYGSSYRPNGISSYTLKNGEEIKLNPEFWSDISNHDLGKAISLINISKLFIHGTADKVTPLSEMEAYYVNAGEPKEKVVIEGADHGMRPHREKVNQIIVRWFAKHLK
ncbi:MAG: alpha/beta fold hydrolase [bacterium]